MKKWDDEKLQQIQDLFDKRINPVLAGHGGFAELIDLKEDKLFIKVGGGCHGCGMANATVKQGIQGLVQRLYPEILEVVDVTDHATGSDPYYK